MVPPPLMANLSEVISEAIAKADDCAGAYLPEDFDAAALKATLIDLREHLSLVTRVFAALPVKGSRGMRSCTVLSSAGPIKVYRKYFPGGGRPASPSFSGCQYRVTRSARKAISKCGATLGSMTEASQTIWEMLRFKVSTSRVRSLTLSEGDRILQLAPSKSPLFDKDLAIPCECTSVEETMVLSTDGTCAPCTKADTCNVLGRDGKKANGRELKVAMAGVYKWLDKDRVPVIPSNKRQYVVTDQDCDAIRIMLLNLAIVLGYRTIRRVQFIGDGAIWIARLVSDSFKGAEFTVDFFHACGYLNTLSEELACDDHIPVFKMARRIMKTHSADAALRYFRKKYPLEMENLNEAAQTAYSYLDLRRKNMEYGRLRREGFLIGSGHIESGCKGIVGSRCKLPGMRWRIHNAASVSSIRAAIRSNTFWVI